MTEMVSDCHMPSFLDSFGCCVLNYIFFGFFWYRQGSCLAPQLDLNSWPQVILPPQPPKAISEFKYVKWLAVGAQACNPSTLGG